jgi:sarcosine oxidase subunit gamma
LPAELLLEDLSSMSKVTIRADRSGAVAALLQVAHLRCRRDAQGRLVVGTGPDEWLILGPANAARTTVGEMVAIEDDGLVTVIDQTHGKTLLRLSGSMGRPLLEKVCAIDLSDRRTPDGVAFRTSIADAIAEVVRVDEDEVLSYLLVCERDLGQYLFDVVIDAGSEFGIETDLGG